MHPSLPYLLSSSDDMLIKLWDWDKGWTCNQIFEGHSHYVMQARFHILHCTVCCSAQNLHMKYSPVKAWSSLEDLLNME